MYSIVRVVYTSASTRQPLTYLPRNSLAYAEMRIILARIIYDFDIKMADDLGNWLDRQKTYTLWDRVPLNVYLTPREK